MTQSSHRSPLFSFISSSCQSPCILFLWLLFLFLSLSPPYSLVLAQSSPFPSFCDSDSCVLPSELYSGSESGLNFEIVQNLIPRNSPDGVNAWPYACQDVNCTVILRKVLPPAKWWDGYSEQKALPTNTWWIGYFSDPPGSVNPAGWVWPVYQLPYTTLARQDGFAVGYAAAQQTVGVPGAATTINEDLAPSIIIGLIAQSFLFTAIEGIQYGQSIVTYDQYGLGVQLQYTSMKGGTMDIPVVKGSPFMTFIFQGSITPTIVTLTGFIYTINGIECNTTTTSVPVSPQNTPTTGIFVYDIQTYGSGPLQRWRLYTTTSSPITVFRTGNFTNFYIQAAEVCGSTPCVYRLFCYENDFLDPVYPMDWFTSSQENGGKMSIETSTVDEYANVYPTVASVSASIDSLDFDYTSDPQELTISFTWPIACMVGSCSGTDLLMLALPHHQDLTQKGAPQLPVLSIQIPTMQGIGVGYSGNNWIHVYNLTALLGSLIAEGADPFYANPSLSEINPSAIPTIQKQLQEDLEYWSSNYYANVTFVYADCYLFGKLTAAIARLALIADEIGNSTLAEECRLATKNRLNEWLDPTITSYEFPFYADRRYIYDDVWGGIIPLDGILNPGQYWTNDTEQLEFGSGGYNDHLFHYGYFLYSVAAVLKSNTAVDIAWFDKLRLRVLALTRDIANPDPVNDPYFTMFRHKSDWYSAHSWASGLFPSALTPNVESTSEGVNAWYSLILLGSAMTEAGDDLGNNLYQVGKVLAATDIHSIRFYVQSWSDWGAPDFPPLRTQILPEDFMSLGVVGNLWGGAAQYETFFAFGACQWAGEPNYDPSACYGLHLLSLPQILYSNQLFIYLIQFLPLTPMSNWLNQRDWLEQSFNTQALVFGDGENSTSFGYNPIGKAETFPDLFNGCVSVPQNVSCQSWMAYTWSVLSMLGSTNRETAWNEVLTFKRTYWGNTLTNSLWFIATQHP